MFPEPGPASVKLLGRRRGTDISDMEEGRGNAVVNMSLCFSEAEWRWVG